MAKSRTLRFIEHLEKESCGTITTRSEGAAYIRAEYREGTKRATYYMPIFLVELSVLEPEFMADIVLDKLANMGINDLHKNAKWN